MAPLNIVEEASRDLDRAVCPFSRRHGDDTVASWGRHAHAPRWPPMQTPADIAPHEDLPQPVLRYRTLWISDIHLGTPGCQALALLDFLKATECETLYLVGDIIDGWQLRRGWYWPQSHNDVVQKLLRKVRKGTRVVFVPGNHDEFARRYLGHSFGGVEVVEDCVHVTADGRRLWVTHGDLFDGVIQCAKWLAYLGDSLYEFTLKLNRYLNHLRATLGLPYWSLSKYLKLKVKRAVSYVSDFENALAREARKRGMQGVVCGHIHHAELRDIDGILYANDGDWVESLSALAEHDDGRLELLDWAHWATGPLARPAGEASPAIPPAALPQPWPEPAALAE
jgi:UDP-2,3-diacylglucosamine pyrophosphatase LpxH